MEVARAQGQRTTWSPAAYEWSGFHFGGFAGWAWSELEASPLFTKEFGGNFYLLPGNSYGFEDDGFHAGVQAGYDRQWQQFVFGVAGEVGYLTFDKSAEDPNFLPSPFPDSRAVTRFQGDWYGSFTARAGVVLAERILLYARGGVAALNAEASTIDKCGRGPCGVLTIDARGDDVLWGWTVGGGMEVALDDHWSVGGEYRYFDFEDLQVKGVASNSLLYTQDLDFDFHQVRGFASYRW